MGEVLFFEDLKIGDRWVSRGRTVTESDVVSFGCLTGDLDPLHMDHEFCRNTPFRKPIAHGLLGLAWVAGLGSTSPSISTLAFLAVKEWEFLKPVYFGDTVHVVNEILRLRPNGRKRGFVTWQRSLVNHEGIVVQKGLFETLVACRGTATKAVASGKATPVVASETPKGQPVKKNAKSHRNSEKS